MTVLTRFGTTFIVSDDAGDLLPYSAAGVIGAPERGMGHLAVWIAPNLLFTIMPGMGVSNYGTLYRVAAGGGFAPVVNLDDALRAKVSQPLERGNLFDWWVGYVPCRKSDEHIKVSRAEKGYGMMVFCGFGNGGERRWRGIECELAPDGEGRIKVQGIGRKAMGAEYSDTGVALILDFDFNLVGLTHSTFINKANGYGFEALGYGSEGFLKGILWREQLP